MRGSHQAPRALILASMALASVMGCSHSSVCNMQGPAINGDGQPANATGHKRYETWSKVMNFEISTLVEDAAISELNKDPEDTDFKLLGDWCRKAAYYYGLGNDEKSHLYFSDEEERGFARKTQEWFLQMAKAADTEMAKAADARNPLPLVNLLNMRRKYCTQCHE